MLLQSFNLNLSNPPIPSLLALRGDCDQNIEEAHLLRLGNIRYHKKHPVILTNLHFLDKLNYQSEK